MNKSIESCRANAASHAEQIIQLQASIASMRKAIAEYEGDIALLTELREVSLRHAMKMEVGE